MTVFLPPVSVALCVERLERVFPRAAFDTVMSSPLAAASVAAMIYLGAVRDDTESAEQRHVRPSMVMWLNDGALAHADDVEREAWYRAALVSKKKVAELEQSWGLVFAQRYADNTRETLRDETFPKWREQGAIEQRPGLPTASSAPRWVLPRHFADLFDPTLDGDALTKAVDQWIQTHMSTAGRMRAMSARRLESSGHLVDVVLPDGSHRQLEPGDASSILKGVIEEWAPRKLKSPLVLSISEPGDKIYLADAKLLASVGIQIDMSAVLPDALILDGEAEPLQFWIVEAVATDGEINERRKKKLLEWASAQGIPAENCRFLTAFTSRNAAPARRRLKDLASGTQAWFLQEPAFELTWSEIEVSGRAKLAIVTPIGD